MTKSEIEAQIAQTRAEFEEKLARLSTALESAHGYSRNDVAAAMGFKTFSEADSDFLEKLAESATSQIPSTVASDLGFAGSYHSVIANALGWVDVLGRANSYLIQFKWERDANLFVMRASARLASVLTRLLATQKLRAAFRDTYDTAMARACLSYGIVQPGSGRTFQLTDSGRKFSAQFFSELSVAFRDPSNSQILLADTAE
jgi:hypothetical protein